MSHFFLALHHKNSLALCTAIMVDLLHANHARFLANGLAESEPSSTRGTLEEGLESMSDTSAIVREMNPQVHKPVTRMIMSYIDPKTKKPDSKLLRMGDRQADAFLLKTLRWASHNGVEVTFRPA